MTINNNKKELRWESCHLPQSKKRFNDESAMEEMRNPDQVEQPAENLLWLVYITGLWTCAVDNKQQTSSRLKKTADDLIIKIKKRVISS
jgi:hypothetical protein